MTNVTDYLPSNETVDLRERCLNLNTFNCTESELLWVTLGPQQLPFYLIVLISTLLIIIFLTGFLGNQFVCVVIISRPIMHTSINAYLFNLAVSDLMLLLSGIPFDLMRFWKPYPYQFSDEFCQFRALVSEMASFASVLNISALSVERYLAVQHPLHMYASKRNLSRASKVIAGIWIFSVMCAIPYAWYTRVSFLEYPPGSGIMSMQSAVCDTSASLFVVEIISIVFFVVAGVVIFFPHFQMCQRIGYLGSTHSDDSHMTNGVSGRVHGSHRAQTMQHINRMLVMIVLAFIFCWAPHHLQRMYQIYGTNLKDYQSWNQMFDYISALMYYVSATVNPILYSVMSHRYRQALHQTMLCRRVRLPAVSPQPYQRAEPRSDSRSGSRLETQRDSRLESQQGSHSASTLSSSHRRDSRAENRSGSRGGGRLESIEMVHFKIHKLADSKQQISFDTTTSDGEQIRQELMEPKALSAILYSEVETIMKRTASTKTV